MKGKNAEGKKRRYIQCGEQEGKEVYLLSHHRETMALL